MDRWIPPILTGDKRTITSQDWEIVRLVAEGLGNKQIAARVGLAPGTINQYLHWIFRLWGVQSRMELALQYLGLGNEEATLS